MEATVAFRRVQWAWSLRFNLKLGVHVAQSICTLALLNSRTNTPEPGPISAHSPSRLSGASLGGSSPQAAVRPNVKTVSCVPVTDLEKVLGKWYQEISAIAAAPHERRRLYTRRGARSCSKTRGGDHRTGTL